MSRSKRHSTNLVLIILVVALAAINHFSTDQTEETNHVHTDR